MVINRYAFSSSTLFGLNGSEYEIKININNSENKYTGETIL